MHDDEFIAGTPAQVAEQIIEQCRACGAGHILAILGRAVDQRRARAVELFGGRGDPDPAPRRCHLRIRGGQQEKRSMAQRTRPPFRADHVGSLIRPQELRDARQAHLEGKLPAAELRVIEDRLIREVVAMQERVGLQAVTDGEFRRTSFREVLFESIDGFSKERVETDFSFSYADGSTRRATPVPKVTVRLQRRGSMAAGDFRFLKTATTATPKVMLPAPSLAHWFVGDRVFAGSPYAQRTRVYGRHRAHLSGGNRRACLARLHLCADR